MCIQTHKIACSSKVENRSGCRRRTRQKGLCRHRKGNESGLTNGDGTRRREILKRKKATPRSQLMSEKWGKGERVMKTNVETTPSTWPNRGVRSKGMFPQISRLDKYLFECQPVKKKFSLIICDYRRCRPKVPSQFECNEFHVTSKTPRGSTTPVSLCNSNIYDPPF